MFFYNVYVETSFAENNAIKKKTTLYSVFICLQSNQKDDSNSTQKEKNIPFFCLNHLKLL